MHICERTPCKGLEPKERKRKMLVPLRIALGQSYGNPIERMMRVVNLGIQGLALCRERCTDDKEKHTEEGLQQHEYQRGARNNRWQCCIGELLKHTVLLALNEAAYQASGEGCVGERVLESCQHNWWLCGEQQRELQRCERIRHTGQRHKCQSI